MQEGEWEKSCLLWCVGKCREINSLPGQVLFHEDVIISLSATEGYFQGGSLNRKGIHLDGLRMNLDGLRMNLERL